MGCIFVEVCGGPLPYEKITTLADLTKEMLIKRKSPSIPEFITGQMRDVCKSCLSFHYQDRPSSQKAFELLKAAKKAWKELSSLSAKALCAAKQAKFTRMGCSQSLSTHAVPAPSEPARTEAPKLREERNSPASPASLTSLKIGNRSEPECEPKIARRDWNSWKHEVDLVDLKLMESGQSLPVNQPLGSWKVGVLMDFLPQWDTLDPGAYVNLVLLPVMMATPKGHLYRLLGTTQYVYLQGDVAIKGTGTFLRLVLVANDIIPVLSIQSCTKQYEQEASSYATVFRCLDLCAGAGFMSIGARAVGYQDVGGIDQNSAFQALYEQIHDGPFWNFDIGDMGAIEHCLDKGLMGSTILSGINCQPYSRAGDQRGFADPRAMSLPHTLKFALFLQSPCVCLECTPAAAQDPQVQQLIHEFCKLVGFVPTQSILHLDRCWAARRDRWWCVLMPAILGKWEFPDLPLMPEYQRIQQIMPYVKEWPSQDLQELALTHYEHLKFLEFSGPLSKLMMDTSKSMPTALHAWGNQLYKCQCGCRQAFSDHRLRTKGLHAMLIPTGISFQHEGTEHQAGRHPHPNEVLLLCGMYPNLDFQGKMRLGLAAAGQLASPIQSAWVLGHVKKHIEDFLNLPSTHDPHQLLTVFQQSLLRARDISWPVRNILSSEPSQEGYQKPVELSIITIRADCPGGAVSHTVSLATGTSVLQLCQAESAAQQVHEKALTFYAEGQQHPLAMDHLLLGGESLYMKYSESDDVFPCPPRQLWPNQDGVGECLQNNQDAPMPVEASVPPSTGPLELPLDLAVPVGDGVVEGAKRAKVQPRVITDPLCRLPASALLTLVAPQVASQSTLDSLRSQTIPSGDRQQVLSTQGDLWADDELCFHLQKIVQAAPSNQQVISWDPLAITSLWTSQHAQVIQQWGQALPPLATIITAVWIKAHWVPFLWRKENQKLFGYTYGNPPEHEASLQQFHAKVGEMCRCTIEPLHNEKALVNRFCGATCIAYFRHLIGGQGMLIADQIPACHQALRQEFADGLSDVTPRPWIWGRGSDEFDATLHSLLRQHGVAAEDITDRAEHIKSTLGTSKVGHAMSSHNPWKDLKWLANQQMPPYQLIRPLELEKAIASRSRDGAPVGSKRLKQKGSGKGKKGFNSKQHLEPSSLRIADGTFVAGETAVSQIGIGDIGPLATGIVLGTTEQAVPFLGKNHPISMGGLAIVVIGDIDISENAPQLPMLVRFPAICVANSEPILVEGKVFQLGKVDIQRPIPQQAVDLTTIDTFVAKNCVHRDLFQGDWEVFGSQPMKHIISQLPFLQTCSDAGCHGCAKWHATDEARDPIMAVWNRQWLSNAYTPTKPEAADMYVVTIRVPTTLEMSRCRQRGSNASSSSQAWKGSSGPEPAKAKGKGKSQPAKVKGKGKSGAADSKGKGKGKPGKADEGPRRRTTGDPRRRANKGPDTLGCLTRGSHSRIKRNAARALKQAGLPVPKNLRPGKTVQDLEPAKAEEAKQLQRKLKELTWTESMSARKMQTEIYWTKERLKQLLAPDDEEKDPDEFEEVPADEEEDEEESSSSSSDDKLAKAQLKAAQEELAKAKQELAKAKEAKEKKKEKKKAKIEQEEKQQDEEMPQAVEEPEKADGVKAEPAKAEAEPEKAEAEPEKADEDELPDYDLDEESWTEVEGKQRKKKKKRSKGGKTDKDDNIQAPPGPEGDKDGEAPTTKA
eukprot:symbB.v1.2.012745.t1/scaffold886.1/size155167/1